MPKLRATTPPLPFASNASDTAVDEDKLMEDDPMEGDPMEDNPRTIELDTQAAGGTNESVSLKEAEVGTDTHQEDSIDCDMQVEAMVRLLEEGLDRLKISVDVAKPALPGLDGSSKIPSGVTTPLHSGSDGPGTTGLTVPVGPSQATAMPDLEAATANQSSFHKMAEIIRELTKMVKARTDTEDLISVTLLSDYNILRECLRIEGDPTPDKTASLRIASCKPSQWENRLTKGPWFARRLQKMANHVLKHRQLPERRQGKGGKHPSLLDQKDVRAAIEKFVNNCETGTVRSCSGQPLLLLSLRSLVT